MTQTLPTRRVLELRDELRSGALSAVTLAEACIERILAREPEIKAWAWFDPAHVRREAARLDAIRTTGEPLGALHGIPVGVKDIIDTALMPTENGCPLDAGRIPQHNAVLVERLKRAGALVLGKTTTTELAFLHPSKTRNPRHPDHTPGGSSSGSAAAVADGMVPLAIGTQTGGSVIRPASFCGVTGFKPSFGAIPTKGVLVQSPTLDTPGVFAGDPESAWALAAVLMHNDDNRELDFSMPPQAPTIGFIRPPGWAQMDETLRAKFESFVSALDCQTVTPVLPEGIKRAAEHRARINASEMAYHFRSYYSADKEKLGPETRSGIEEGQEISATAYLASRAYRENLIDLMGSVFESCDVLLCPAALGGAPYSLASTGDSIFNGVWTMTGAPCITLPLITSTAGLSVGVQLVGKTGEDARLIEAARWLWEHHSS